VAVYRRTRPRFILVLLVLTAATIITVDGRGSSGPIDGARRLAHEAFAPVGRAAGHVVNPVADWARGLVHSASLGRENARLRRELRDARNQAAQRGDVVRQNQELGALLHLPSSYDLPAVTARVLAGAAGNFDATVELDRGSAAHVEVGNPVVSADGLVGRVIHVARHSSTVLLLTDPQSAVGVRFATSGETAVAQGTGDAHSLRVDLVDLQSAVAVGEMAVTSGLERGRYPAGIPVGVVTVAASPAGALQRRVRIAPVAAGARLDLVKILRYVPPQI